MIRAFFVFFCLVSSLGYAGSGHVGKMPIDVTEAITADGLKALAVENTFLFSGELVLLNRVRRALVEKQGPKRAFGPCL